MNDTAQIIIAVATLITSLGTIILGLVNRSTINTVKTQTDGMLIGLKHDAHEKGRLLGVAETVELQKSVTDEPLKVEVVKIPKI